MFLRFLKWLALVIGVILVCGAGYFWYVFMSPYGYESPAPTALDERVSPQEVFVYGTLRHDLVRWVILGEASDTREAQLAGYRRHDLDILADPAASVEGEILSVSPEELRALDRYERLGVRYQRESVKLADGTIAWVYQRIPDAPADAGEQP